MFGFFRRRKRKKYMERPVPNSWLSILEKNTPFYLTLDKDEKNLFLNYLKVFFWEKTFIGAAGLEISEEIKVVISAVAVRLILFLDLDYYNQLSEIIVYPYHYKHPGEETIILGEAQSSGRVVLSWDAVQGGLKNPHDGHDTATHEFAHVLDVADGSFNGAPILKSGAHYKPWALVMNKHYELLNKGKRTQRKVLRQYGATNEAEFFAVATEAFFEKPKQMKKKTPDLYKELQAFYGFDPASRNKEH